MSVSFHEIQFDPRISQGAAGGMRFSTTINILSGGHEQRNVNWKKSRGEWDVSKGMQTPEQVGYLVDFFANRRGKAYGFRFKDWSDYRLPRWRSSPGDIEAIPVFMTTDGGTTTSFQLTRVYTDLGGTYVRIITKPYDAAKDRAGGYALHLLDNGTPTNDFSVDTATGIVTLGSTLRATTGHVVSGACEFNVPVRFDTDDQKISVTTTEIMSWQTIPIVEIRDI